MLLYINLIKTTNQKSIIYTHIKERLECNHNTKDNHQITKEGNRRKKGINHLFSFNNNFQIICYVLVADILDYLQK